ncbi:MAG: N-acetylmuramoyl-L-alanine amidase [Actinobacteria bacterium]|nr:N-acetylmuramoyl-L-alanine amidase [Actinomycetota bacterium]
MTKKKSAQYCFYIKKTSPFFRISFSVILAFIVLTVSFFMLDAKSIFAYDNSSILIVIDPGHGGWDTGTIGPTGLREKDVNLDIAARLRDKLTEAGFKVLLTRESDINHSAEEIGDFANTNNADLFISVHNNGHPSRDKNGTEAFYFYQSPATSNFLASFINTKTIEQIGTLNRGVKAASYKVLRLTKMISALIEGAFISNPDEEAKLKDPNYRDKIATGIYNGIVEYLKTYGQNILSVKRLASAQSFVKRIYQKSLDMNPDEATTNNWANKLAEGAISHADMIREVITSKQFKDRNLTDEQYVDVLYKAVLDRDPDSDGAAHWLKQLKTQNRKAVLNAFLSSAEFKSLISQYNQYGYSYTTALNLSVLNGVGIKGIAAKTSGLFKGLKNQNDKYKYNISKVADADNYNYQNTQIICKSKDSEIAEAAKEIKTILKVGNVTTQNGNSQDSDIIVIIGKDYLSAAEATTSTSVTDESSELIRINILNGQGAPGIAAKVKSKIETDLSKYKGIIKITEAKNANNFNYKNTKIIIFTTKTGINNIADDLKKLLGAGEISKSSNNVDNVDITVILGSDYKK